MNFKWDENKRQTNVRKHKIDFADAQKIFQGHTVTLLDDRVDYEEERYISFGMIGEIVIAVVHTENKEEIRIISARRASKYEEKIYFSTYRD